MNQNRIIHGDALTALQGLPDGSVDCCVTSPPYWGLRDYGHAAQIGLERTPDEYVAKLVTVFAELRRTLRDDGTLWLNIGDSYAREPAKGGSGPNGKHDDIPSYGDARRIMSETAGSSDGRLGRGARAFGHLRGGGDVKPKDLVGIPWMLAFALRADGWWLRCDIVWAKPNPMPESVRDRPTKAHEYVFLLSKSERYYFDADAVAEKAEYPGDLRAVRSDTRKAVDPMCKDNGSRARTGNPTGDTRNIRSVWHITTQPYGEAHFATMPPALVEPCIKAGSRIGGTVLDPFSGAGTVGVVASRLGRAYIGIELNPDYVAMSARRIYGDAPLFNRVATESGS